MKKIMLFLSVIMGQIVFAGPQLVGLTLESNATSINIGEPALLTVNSIYADAHTEEITDNIVWEITPADSAEIKGNILTAKKDGQVNIKAKVDNLVSDTLVLEIYWEVNGHKLPPEPDKELNDSTLLGIDVNDNGVRDDVERWIYQTYDHPIERGIFMQSARAYNKVIVDPSRAHETTVYIDDVSSCTGYWKYWKVLFKDRNESFYLDRYRSLAKEIRPIQFNTLKRHMAYERFNAEFNGEVFSAPSVSKEKCEFDQNGILKDLP